MFPGDMLFVVDDPGDGYAITLLEDPYIDLLPGMPALYITTGEYRTASIYLHNGGLVEIFENDLRATRAP